MKHSVVQQHIKFTARKKKLSVRRMTLQNTSKTF